jgi:hypothetical protein
LKATTLDLWQEITESRKFVRQEFIWITELQSQVPTLRHARTAQLGKQMSVHACKGFA